MVMITACIGFCCFDLGIRYATNGAESLESLKEKEQHKPTVDEVFDAYDKCILVNGLMHTISESPRGSMQHRAGMDLLEKLGYKDCK
jgi:hypothetical protein